MQSKLQSFLEANLNTAVGFVLSISTWHWVVPLIMPQLAPHAGWGESIGITVLFTIVSLARNYGMRRAFNYWSTR